MLKMDEIKKLDEKVIKSKIQELRVDLFNYRMQKTTSGIEKPHLIREAKKNIARLLTENQTRQNK